MEEDKSENVIDEDVIDVTDTSSEQQAKTEEIKPASAPVQSRTPSALEQKIQSFRLPKFRLPKLSEIPGKLMYMLREYKRVIIVSKKPDIDELSKISKISGLGILVIGFLGFIIQLVFQLIKGVA